MDISKLKILKSEKLHLVAMIKKQIKTSLGFSREYFEKPLPLRYVDKSLKLCIVIYCQSHAKESQQHGIILELV